MNLFDAMPEPQQPDSPFGSALPAGHVPVDREEGSPGFRGGMSVGRHLHKKDSAVTKTDLNALQRKWFRDNGWTFEKVERPNTFGSVTVDLWGFADWLACHPAHGIWLIQTTSHSNAANREAKSRKAPELRAWLESGGKFAVHGWEQPGGKKTRWRVVERVIGLDELDAGQKRFRRKA